MTLSLETVAAARTQLWQAGFRPVPIHNWDAKGPSPGKRPLGDNWRESALKDPPFCVTIAAVAYALNTGILCDGLRAIDIDIDDPDLAARIGALAVEWFGPAPVRTRRNTARHLLLYAAAAGQPRKLVITGRSHTKENGCKVEALGAGQQFVALGRHDSGAHLEWSPAPPGQFSIADLPTITESDLAAFMAEAAVLIDAQTPGYTNGHGHDRDHHAATEPQAEPLRVAAAMAAIANTGPADWEAWNRVGMALWAATGGSTLGGELWNAWSARHPAYNLEATEERWRHYQRSPPTQIGAGTLFHMAGATFRAEQTPPPDQEPPDWVNENTRSGTEQGAEQTDAHPILTARQFFNTFTVPDYLIDGIIQLGRVYALTSPTGHGKTAVALLLACMVSAGRRIGNIETEQARVLFLAGENPDDLTARFHAACQVHGLDPDILPLDFMPGNFPLDPEAAEKLRQKIDATGHTYGMIFGDSIAAYFSGDNENDNVQMGASARSWRVLSTCRGTPAVIGLAHPIKNPDRENLLPRGGGAFIAEIDANLTLWAEGERETTTLHWAGKIRGADFAPLTFALTPVKLTGKADKKGRPFISVVAVVQSEEQASSAMKRTVSDENVVLEWLRRYPDITQRDIAINAGWQTPEGKPIPSKVNRLLKSLRTNKLVKNWRGKWLITDLGIAELKGIPEDQVMPNGVGIHPFQKMD